MKKILTVVAVVVVLVGMLFFMAACGDQHDEALIGTWAWEADETSSITTTFNADGTGTHSTNWSGYGTTFNWRTRGRNIVWSYPGFGDVETPYTISGDVWTFTMADGTQFRYIRR